jgi:hypothetical protein
VWWTTPASACQLVGGGGRSGRPTSSSWRARESGGGSAKIRCSREAP